MFYWNEEGIFTKLDRDINNSPPIDKISVGSDFGHIIDTQGNLYGWGNNKNGELGTSDTYPRRQLTQVRVFNKYKQYLRCTNIYNGHSFSFALFESIVNCDPPIQSNRSKSYNLPM